MSLVHYVCMILTSFGAVNLTLNRTDTLVNCTEPLLPVTFTPVQGPDLAFPPIDLPRPRVISPVRQRAVSRATSKFRQQEEMDTINGARCKFPFIYEGFIHEACTSHPNNRVEWCATSVYGKGYMRTCDNCLVSTRGQEDETVDSSLLIATLLFLVMIISSALFCLGLRGQVKIENFTTQALHTALHEI